MADLASLDLTVDLPPGVEIVEVTAANSAEWMQILDGRYGLDANGSSFVRAVFDEDISDEIGALHSTPMARGMYRSIEFNDVAIFELWAEPDRVNL